MPVSWLSYCYVCPSTSFYLAILGNGSTLFSSQWQCRTIFILSLLDDQQNWTSSLLQGDCLFFYSLNRLGQCLAFIKEFVSQKAILYKVPLTYQ